MPENKDYGLRIETIDECLRNTRRQWTLAALTEAVNTKLQERYSKTAAQRTIQQDIKQMKELKSAPIVKIKKNGKNYFTYSNANFSIKNIPVGGEEINLLRDTVDILKQISYFSIASDIEGVVQKLQNMAAVTDPDSHACYIQFENHNISSGTNFIDDLFTAIKTETALRISYKPFNALAPAEGIYHPYLLKEYRNRWFLICRQGNSTQVTTLALDRITKIKNSGQSFIKNDIFDPEIYFNSVIGVSVPEKFVPEKITVRVTAQQAPYLMTKPLHYSQELIHQAADKSILIAITVAVNFELKAVLMSYGPAIEIVAPAHLREEMAKLAKSMAVLYGK